jgi:signal transduction histidine kinase
MNLETDFFFKSNRARPGPLPAHKSAAAAFTHTMQQMIDDLPEEIALLDQDCRMLAVNRSWRYVCVESGNLDAMPGCNYREVCKRKAAEGYEPAARAYMAFGEISSGQRDFWQMTYNGGLRWSGRDYQFCMHRIAVGAETLIMVTRFDLSELLELRRIKKDFSASLVRGQTMERQRVARELHDSTSQLLATIGLLLGRLRLQSPNRESLSVVEELQELLTQAHQEIRLISYLAHPPEIEKMGLADALKALVKGFGRRTGVDARFEIQGKGFLPAVTESAFYRIAQEALSNVHRHSRASRVRLMLSSRPASAHLVIADDGVGISRDILAGSEGAGVGLASMRSRLREIGGRLMVRALSPGTMIVASVNTERKYSPSGMQRAGQS